MFIVEIKDCGLVINLPGIPSFRTPGQLKVQDNKLPQFINEIKKAGCKDFIISSSDMEVDVWTKKEIVEKQVVEVKNNDNNNKELDVKLKNIEDLLQKILKKDPTIIENIVMSSEKNNLNKKNKKVEEDEEVIFIPSFKNNDSNVVSSNLSNVSENVVSEIDDMQSIIDQLSEI